MTSASLVGPAVGETVATSVDDAEALRDEWLRLRSTAKVRPPTADPDRFITLVRTCADEMQPYVVLGRGPAGPQYLIAGRISTQSAPCRIGYLRLRTPRLRQLWVEYGGLITDGTTQACEAVLRHLTDALRARVVERIMINHLPVDHELFEHLSRLAGLRSRIELHWSLPLTPGAWDEMLKGVSRDRRSTIRRKERRLNEYFAGDVTFRLFDRPDQIAEFVEGAAKVASHTYQAALGVSFSDTPAWRAILSTEAEHSRLRCYWLECAGRPITFQVGFAYGRTYFLDTLGFLPEHRGLSPGGVLHIRIAQDLCNAGFDRFDYGFGDADYKRQFGAESWDEVTLHLFGPGVRPWLSKLLERAASLVSYFGQSTIGRMGMTQRVKRIWRDRLRRTAGGDKE